MHSLFLLMKCLFSLTLIILNKRHPIEIFQFYYIMILKQLNLHHKSNLNHFRLNLVPRRWLFSKSIVSDIRDLFFIAWKIFLANWYFILWYDWKWLNIELNSICFLGQGICINSDNVNCAPNTLFASVKGQSVKHSWF